MARYSSLTMTWIISIASFDSWLLIRSYLVSCAVNDLDLLRKIRSHYASPLCIKSFWRRLYLNPFTSLGWVGHRSLRKCLFLFCDCLSNYCQLKLASLIFPLHWPSPAITWPPSLLLPLWVPSQGLLQLVVLERKQETLVISWRKIIPGQTFDRRPSSDDWAGCLGQ